MNKNLIYSDYTGLTTIRHKMSIKKISYYLEIIYALYQKTERSVFFNCHV